MDSLSQFFKPDYIFNSRPPFVMGEFLFYLIFFTIILIGTIILKKLFDKKGSQLTPYKFFSEKFFYSFITCVVIGFVLLFFRWEYIYYISSRILIIIDFLIILFFLVMLIIYLLKKLPREVEEFNNKLNYQKYIPQSKATSKRPKGRTQ